MDMHQALVDLDAGEDKLAEPVREALGSVGIAELPGACTPRLLSSMRAALAELEAQEGDSGGREVNQEVGTYRLSDLLNKHDVFDECVFSPLLLAAAHYLLGDFKLSSISSRAALPGHGHQALHEDWDGDRATGDSFQTCNSIWLLDDFTADNGATRFVPGSHRSRRGPGDPYADHPDQKLLLARAGTVFVFNGHLLHGGTLNRTLVRRTALNVYFTRRGNKQQIDQAAFIRPTTKSRLHQAARFVLDI